jgi:ParB-like chromosome segregation protein Spo0J
MNTKQKTSKNPQIQMLETNSLIPYINNARVHSDEQILQLASSIKEFGFNQPILIDETNGVIAGHGRLLAAKKLELENVPCIKLEHLTEAQKKAYIIADNKIAQNATWDFELLKLEVQNLQQDFDFKNLGFNREELDGLLGEFEHDIDVIEEIDESVNFIIKCDNISEKEQIKNKLGITTEKTTFKTFMEILNGFNSNR